MTNQYPTDFFRRIDDSDDELFYSMPRLVVHIDEAAIERVGQIYAESLPAGGTILDLMSSWRSHLPVKLRPTRVVGLGLSRPEMDDNPALTERVVHNLNRNPRLPFDDSTFDGAVVTVSIQYMTRPVEVFADVGRVLKPGAPFIVTFSNRMFPTKAVAVWRALSDRDRMQLVGKYFVDSAAFEKVQMIDRRAISYPTTDPVFAVLGFRKREIA
ncbi:MAG: class I SAM-dependent methyltransferase [Candidatus Binataceae bacterium]